LVEEYKIKINNLNNEIKKARNIIFDYECVNIKYIEENK
jgi:hypothetical protein